MASELIQSNRQAEASVFIKHAIEMAPGTIIPNLLAVLVYADNPVLYSKYLSVVKRLGKRHRGLIPARATEPGEQPGLVLREAVPIEESREEASTQDAAELTVDQVDDLFYAAVDYFTNQELYGVALKFLDKDF